MKKLIQVLLLSLVTASAFSQTVPTGVPQLFAGKFYQFKGYTLIDSAILTNGRDTNFTPIKPAIVFREADSAFYYHNKLKWIKFLSGAVSMNETDPTVSSVVKSINATDTAQWRSAWRKRVVAVSYDPFTSVFQLTMADGSILTTTIPNSGGISADSNNYTTSANFNATNGDISLTRSGLSTLTFSIDGRYVLNQRFLDSLAALRNAIGGSSGGADGNNYIVSQSFNTGTGDLTSVRNGMSSIVTNLDGRYAGIGQLNDSVAVLRNLIGVGGPGGDGDGNNYVNALTFDNLTGNLRIYREGMSMLQVSLDGRYPLTQRFLDSILAIRNLYLNINGSETKVTAGVNVTISGVGTTASPYVITAGSTNLLNTPTSTNVAVASSSGTGTTIAGATTSLAGVMTAADKVLVNSIPNKLNISDTAAMLANYLLPGDTISLSNRINALAVAGPYLTGLTGDVSATGPGTVAATLSATGVVAGTYGNATSIPRITVDAKGRVTSITTVTIEFDGSSIETIDTINTGSAFTSWSNSNLISRELVSIEAHPSVLRIVTTTPESDQVQFNSGTGVLTFGTPIQTGQTIRAIFKVPGGVGGGGIGTEVDPTVPDYLKNNLLSPNVVAAGPASGGAGAGSFRLLTPNDIPGLPASQITTGRLAEARGGTPTGATTGQYLVYNGTAWVPQNLPSANLYIGNAGPTGNGIFVANGDNARFKKLVASTNMTITPTDSTLVFAASGSGSGITALTGDVVASGTGSVAATIPNATIDAARLASNAVTTAKILDANVTGAKIADGAVTNAKLGGNYPSGDLSGPMASPNVVALRGITISNTTPTTGQILRYNGTNWTASNESGGGGGGGSGTVTDFTAGNLAGLFTTSVSTSTTTPSLTFSAVTGAQNQVFAAPTSGSGGGAYRYLVSGDLPTVPHTKGGTGLTSLGTSGQSIRVNSGATGYEWYTPGAGGLTLDDMINPSLGRVRMDDFQSQQTTSGTVGELDWNFGGSGSASSVNTESGRMGIQRFNSSTTASTISYFSLHGTATSGICTFAEYDKSVWIFRLPSVATDFDIRLGFMYSQSAATQTHGVYLEKLNTDADMYFVSANASTATRTSVITSAAASTWYKVVMRRITSSSVGISVNGGTEVVITTNIPDGSDTMGPVVQITPTTTTQRGIDFDLIGYQLLPVSR